MRFRIQVKGRAENPWWESYDKPVADPEAWAKELIERFNKTLRPWEAPRKLLAVEVLGKGPAREHTWEKQNLMTVFERGQMFDVMKCRVCGVTAKRYGLVGVTIDSKWRAKAYRRCDTAVALMAKKAVAV